MPGGTALNSRVYASGQGRLSPYPLPALYRLGVVYLISIKATVRFNGRPVGANIGGKGSNAIAVALAQNSVIGTFTNYINTGQFLADVGERVAERAKLRTRQGTDVGGAKFQEYSPRYRKQKEKWGRYRGKADLYLSGSMLNSVAFFSDTKLRGAVRIRDFTLPGRKISAADLGRVHHLGLGRMPKREWFAWRNGSPEDAKLRREARNLIVRFVRQRQRGMYGVPVFTSRRGIGTELT